MGIAPSIGGRSNVFQLATPQGLVTEAFDHALSSGATGAEATGRVSAALAPVLGGTVIKGIVASLSVAGVTMTHGQFVVYDKNYKLLGSTADSPASFQVTGTVQILLSAPVTIGADGVVYLGYFVAGTTPPSFVAAGGLNLGTFNGGVKRVWFQDGQASPPATATPSDRGSIPWLGAY